MFTVNHKKFWREGCNLVKRVSHGNSNQVALELTVSGMNDRCPVLLVTIKPDDGPYQGAHCVFKVKASSQYPVTPPTVSCLSRVYHPNISYRSGDVCLNVLANDWISGLGLDTCVEALLFLLCNPNIDEPLPSSPVPNGESWETFVKKVAFTLQGGQLERKMYDHLVTF